MPGVSNANECGVVVDQWCTASSEAHQAVGRRPRGVTDRVWLTIDDRERSFTLLYPRLFTLAGQGEGLRVYVENVIWCTKKSKRPVYLNRKFVIYLKSIL